MYYHFRWLEKPGYGQIDGLVRRSHSNGENPELRASHYENEISLEDEKELVTSSNNENPFDDGEFLNPVFGDFGYQFHTKNENK